ncbi:AaceriAFR136Cp [[Ashbya] aceris (nom. inval.)]|nr:AaceriAFR136Cp [[Ashbya] aceris (nom. inval.)]
MAQLEDPKERAGRVGESQHGQHHNTAFIHKLYSMLEDDNMKDLIWWSASQNSFLIKPNEKFSKALATFFKHTNVASFVRQLNMYGFHKVSDHKPSSAKGTSQDEDEAISLWEFRHSMGCFRKGDKESLKSIKRRSSKNQVLLSRNNSAQSLASQYSSQQDLGAGGSSIAGRVHSIESAEKYYNATVYQPPYTDALPQHSQGQVQAYPDMRFPLEQKPHTSGVITFPRLPNSAIEDLRATNLDMMKLLDLVQKAMHISSPSSSNELSGSVCSTSGGSSRSSNQLGNPSGSSHDAISSPSHARSPTGTRESTLEHLNQEIAAFRTTILMKLQRHAEIQLHMLPPTPSQRQSHPQSTYAVSAPPSTGTNFLPYNSSGSIGMSTTYDAYPISKPGMSIPGAISQGFHNSPYLMLDPFAKGSSSSISKKRHMSVLMDPLAPAPMSAPAALQIPALPQPTSTSSSPIHAHEGNMPHANVAGTNSPFHASCPVSRIDSRQDLHHQTSNPPVSEDKRLFSPSRKDSPPSQLLPLLSTTTRGSADGNNMLLAPQSPATLPPTVLQNRLPAPAPQNNAGRGPGQVSITYKPYFPYGTIPPQQVLSSQYILPLFQSSSGSFTSGSAVTTAHVPPRPISAIPESSTCNNSEIPSSTKPTTDEQQAPATVKQSTNNTHRQSITSQDTCTSPANSKSRGLYALLNHDN